MCREDQISWKALSKAFGRPDSAKAQGALSECREFLRRNIAVDPRSDAFPFGKRRHPKSTIPAVAQLYFNFRGHTIFKDLKRSSFLPQKAQSSEITRLGMVNPKMVGVFFIVDHSRIEASNEWGRSHDLGTAGNAAQDRGVKWDIGTLGMKSRWPKLTLSTTKAFGRDVVVVSASGKAGPIRERQPPK